MFTQEIKFKQACMKNNIYKMWEAMHLSIQNAHVPFQALLPRLL